MGRLKFLVRDFRSCHDQSFRDRNESPVKHTRKYQEEEAEEAVEIETATASDAATQCKICWGDEQSVENPLLSSCKCDGSVRFIHYECLSHWLKQKMTLKEDESCCSYTWKQFECELCKTPYPYVFKS
jgi:hypothetical protein